MERLIVKNNFVKVLDEKKTNAITKKCLNSYNSKIKGKSIHYGLGSINRDYLSFINSSNFNSL